MGTGYILNFPHDLKSNRVLTANTLANALAFPNVKITDAGGVTILSVADTFGIIVDTNTGESGIAQKILNKTGVNSVKGTIVSQSTVTDFGFILQANEFDGIGVVYEAGVPDGSYAWVWKVGSRAQVLWADGQSATRGYLALMSPTDGRAYNVQIPSSNPVTAEHFKETGHVLESKVPGTNVLVLCDTHFN